MRILLLTETPPDPPDSGGRLKTLHTIRMLSTEHEVHCHALTRATDSVPGALDRLCRSVTLHVMAPGAARELRAGGRTLFGGLPFLVARHYDPRIARDVRGAADRIKPELVYCDHLSMTPYAGQLRAPVVHDAHNVEFDLVRRHVGLMRPSPAALAGRVEWRALRRYERRAYLASAGVLAISEPDAGAIRALTADRVPVRVVPPALDVAATVPVAPLTRQPTLVYIGGLHWPPNADAVETLADRILPLVRQRVPGAELVVVGRNDTPRARRLRTRPGVRLVGAVPDVRPFLASGRLLVVPLRSGSGVRLKIIEAFAHGVPVVSTAIGHEGLDITPGVELLAGDTPEALADHVLAVLGDDGLASGLATAGRRYALARHDFAVVRPRLLDAVAELAGSA